MFNKKKKVFIGIAKYNGMEYETEQTIKAVLDTRKYWEVGGYMEIIGRSAVSRARNDLATAFLKTDSDFLFFIDTDMTWIPANDKEGNPIDAMIRSDVDIISPPMVSRQQPIRALWHYISKKDLDVWDRTMPFQVLHTGTGFMLIKRRVIEGLLKAGHAAPFMPIWCSEEKVETSDDVAFCRRALQCGFKVWLQPNILIGHIGKYAFNVENIKPILQAEAHKKL
jgi:hypothetical protein